MNILGIESSCDDTSVALVKADKGSFEIIAEKTASQIEVHKKYGGVVPEIAGRMHAEKIIPLIEEVHESARIAKPDVIAVTSGPGLITGLLVGVEAAKNLSYLWNVPVIGVNHIEGHIHSVEIPPLNPPLNKGGASLPAMPGKARQAGGVVFPALALIASGGHTELILIKREGKYKKIGATLDDAAGECFDKVAKLLGFDYPGGPKISKHAETGRTDAIKFPRPMLARRSSKSEDGLDKNNFDFSFAGLKTAALYWLRDNSIVIPTDLPASPCEAWRAGVEGSLTQHKRDSSAPLRSARNDSTVTINDFCASFEQAIIDVLVGKTIKAAEKCKPKTIILAGGVAANKKLRETLDCEIKKIFLNSTPARRGGGFLVPPIKYAMDNAAMIAIAGYYKAMNKKFTRWNKIKADPGWEIS